MKIFKFGGASVKDALGVKNLVNVVSKKGDKNTVVVVSAMGKTTNALEKIVSNYFKNTNDLDFLILELYNYHKNIMNDLFDEKHQIFNEVSILFQKLKFFLENNKSPNHSFVYDQIVAYGEIISTTIINSYLNNKNIDSTWIDARDCIKTDSNYRGGNVQWVDTQKNICNKIKKGKINVTQGFIASDKNNFNTTLGREGSDYTAAIFAYSLNSESVTIWKDVPGVLNGDPKVFSNSKLLDQISYSEAIELAFYGASVIHPKTLQPLQKKEIPLYVKSFLNPDENGTKISKGLDLIPKIPCYIYKGNLDLIKLSSLDFSFIVEDNISKIFKILHEFKMKVDVIQNSAISFSVCIYDKYKNLEDFVNKMEGKFNIRIYKNVSLYTIRHFNNESIRKISKEKKLLLEQRTEKTVRLIFS
ncbi:MAG: aspartate kinase [Bacteroidota bacterium]|nr:aspartate kinase [Bacteroidota bacterium]